jgi:hypothetical protein
VDAGRDRRARLALRQLLHLARRDDGAVGIGFVVRVDLFKVVAVVDHQTTSRRPDVDEVFYPDDDLMLGRDADGNEVFMRRDGTILGPAG